MTDKKMEKDFGKEYAERYERILESQEQRREYVRKFGLFFVTVGTLMVAVACGMLLL